MTMAGGAFLPVVHAAMPGRPDERDTVETAEAVAAVLARAGFDAPVIDLGEDFAPLRALAARGPVAVFNMVEAVGGACSRAHLPLSLMERLGLNFTGAGAEAMALTNSKIATKRALADGKVPIPGWWSDGASEPGDAAVIVKPDGEHASLGIDAGSVVRGRDAAAEIARREARFGGRFFAEAFVPGREFNVSLIDGGGGPRVLPIPEIVFDALPEGRPAIVDYEAKWDPASHAYHHTPRRFGLEAAEPGLAAELGRLALASWRATGVAGYARVDFRVDPQGRPFALEVNANPCLAADAGFAASAAEAGLPHDEMILLIARAALARPRAAA